MDNKERNKKIALSFIVLVLITIIISSLVYYLITKDNNEEKLIQLSDFEIVTLNSYLNNDLIDKNLIGILDNQDISSPIGKSYYALVCYFTQNPFAVSVDTETLENYASSILDLSIDTMSLSNLYKDTNSETNPTTNEVIEKNTIIENLSNSESILKVFFNEIYLEVDGTYKIVANIVKLNSVEELMDSINSNTALQSEIYNQMIKIDNTSDSYISNDNPINHEELNNLLLNIDRSKLLNYSNYKELSTPLCTMDITVLPNSNNLDIQSINFIDLTNQGL